MKNNRLAVIGVGYVGESLIARLVNLDSFEVTAIDSSNTTLSRIAKFYPRVNTLTPYEATKLGRTFDTVIIAVPTPISGGEPDLTHVASASSVAVEVVKKTGLISLESTVGPGDTTMVLGARIDAQGLVDPEFSPCYGFSPERINPGDDRKTLYDVPKIVSGVDEESRTAMTNLYQKIVREVVPASSIREAELAKLLENTFRLVNIALVNQVAIAARGSGVDIWEAVRLASTKPFGFMPFFPSIGVGGHCIPVDPVFLEKGLSDFGDQTIIKEALSANQSHPEKLVERLISKLDQAKVATETHETKILCYGLAYKPNVSDTRNSAAVKIVELLSGFSNLKLYVYDPRVKLANIEGLASLAEEALIDQDVDFVLRLVDHNEWEKDCDNLKCKEVITLI